MAAEQVDVKSAKFNAFERVEDKNDVRKSFHFSHGQ